MEPIEGAVDSLTHWGATGWAWMPGAPNQAVEIEAVLNGRVVGRAIADQIRPDLAETGKGKGRCGFVLTFTEDVGRDTAPLLHARGPNGLVHLPGNDWSSVAGYVDSIASWGATGWAWMPAEPERAVEVEAVLDGKVIGRAIADEMRNDLVASGRGSGRYGFKLLFAASLEGDAVPAIRVCQPTANVELRSPLTVTRNAKPPQIGDSQDKALINLDVEGAVDGLTRWGATGWAWMPGAPHQVLEIEATLGDRVIGRALADQMRPDLAQQGKGKGQCGFVLTFVDDVESDLTPRVHARGPRGPVPLSGDEWSSVAGYVDTVAPWGAVGWAWMPGAPDQALEVEAVLGGKVVGRAVADQMRADLAASKRGSGRYGFTLEFTTSLTGDTLPEFRALHSTGKSMLRCTASITSAARPILIPAVHTEPDSARLHKLSSVVSSLPSYFNSNLIRALSDRLYFDIDFFKDLHNISGSDLDVVINFLAQPMRSASPYFDPVYYNENCKDEILVKGSELEHYLTIGRERGLRPSRIFDGKTVSMSLAEKIEIIKASNLFDPDWYLHKHADVARAKADPLKHYASVGHIEYKRTPNALFDVIYYIRQATDVQELGWNPLIHYILLGSKKGLSTHSLFDVQYFNNVRPVSEPGQSPLACLLKTGMIEGIGPNEFFDPLYYDRVCPEANKYPGGLVAHYMEVGWKAGLNPSERFSTDLYLEANPDVRQTRTAPLYHFLVNGRLEGRNPKPKQVTVPTHFERFGSPEYGASGPALQFDSEVVLPRNFGLSIAVHLHLYYTDMLDEFCIYLRNIPTRFYLFVSVPPGLAESSKISAAFTENLPNCTGVIVARPPNRGRDVAPLLVEFGRKLLAFDIVLHFHTKRSPHNPKHAGWRRYLLHYTIGNSSIVTQILTAFHVDPDLGIMQPPYHPEVRAQPKWGDNRDIVAGLLRFFGMTYVGENCPDFPAGSFFWARVDALRPLFDGRLKLEQFDEEAGQIDKTTAHGIERLFGIIPLLRGYSVESRFIDVGYNLINYYGKSRPFNGFACDRTRDIYSYQKNVRRRGEKRGRIAFVTAIVGPFDALLLPSILEPEIDYYCVTDAVKDGYGVFRLMPCPYFDADPRRMARYVKTNLVRLFPGYDFVVWVDANVLVRSRVAEFVDATEASGRLVGGIHHPIRGTYLEEAKVAVTIGLDDVAVIEGQIKAYQGVDKLDKASLIETNFMVFDARSSKTREFQQLWWNEINKYSRRDQLSVNYCLIKAGLEWHPLLAEYKSTRDSDQFALFRHGLNEWGPKPHIYGVWRKQNQSDGHLLPLPDIHRWNRKADALELDVVICVFNALDDVKLCLSSVEIALSGRGKIILVDDHSDGETAHFLKEYALTKGAVLVRHDERMGYTVAANAGVKAGLARNVLLLNSDTIVPVGALDKMSDSLDRDALLGIVGPLSNAASAQSVPSTANSGSQTAINPIPPGMAIADVDLFFERIWDGELVRTPLVHGFCFCVKRAVFDKIGFFDEKNFPRGYGEENDFCFRAVDAGYDLAVHPGTYIYHAKSKSYAEGERVELMSSGMKALVRIHGRPRISRSVATMNAEPALVRVRAAAAGLFTQDAPPVSENRKHLLLAPALRSDGLPAGSGYVRVLLPYASARIARRWKVTQLRGPQMPDLGAEDVIVVQRDAGFLETNAIEGWIAEVKARGVRLIYEIDDDLLDGHALKIRGFRGSVDDLGYRVMTFARAADAVTVSSDALLKKFSALNENTVFIPNALDADLWRLSECPPRALRSAESRSNGERVTIGYIGTPTHDNDLVLIKDAILQLQALFPNRIDFQVIGGFSDKNKGFGSVIQLPHRNDYPSFVRWLQKNVCWDIGVIPLAANAFNVNKSYLKFLECAALGMALVCSNGPEYGRVVQDGETGLLVENTKTAWLSALSDLVRRPHERVRLAQNAVAAVLREHTLDAVAQPISAVLQAAGQRILE